MKIKKSKSILFDLGKGLAILLTFFIIAGCQDPDIITKPDDTDNKSEVVSTTEESDTDETDEDENAGSGEAGSSTESDKDDGNSESEEAAETTGSADSKKQTEAAEAEADTDAESAGVTGDGGDLKETDDAEPDENSEAAETKSVTETQESAESLTDGDSSDAGHSAADGEAAGDDITEAGGSQESEEAVESADTEEQPQDAAGNGENNEKSEIPEDNQNQSEESAQAEESSQELESYETVSVMPVSFSQSGDVKYESLLELSCGTENAQIYYSFEEFLPVDYANQNLYKEALVITEDTEVYAVAVYKSVVSEIRFDQMKICNMEQLVFGEAEVYADTECTILSVASNLKYNEENNLGAIVGKDVLVTVERNTATQPENWSDSWRVYFTKTQGKTSNSMKFSSTTKRFERIIFESTNSTQGKFTVSDGEFDTKKGIWRGSADSLVFTPTANAQIKKITVIYSTE